MGLAADLATVRALIRRAMNEILRVPGAAIPGVLAPTIFFCGLTAVFGNLTQLPGFDTDSYQSFIIPISMLQGAGFTGAATGVNLARDIEQRLVRPPARLPRPAPGAARRHGALREPALADPLGGAARRRLLDRRRLARPRRAALALFCVMGTGTIAACWGVVLALRYRTQSAAPLMQAGMFILVLTTTAYAPLALLRAGCRHRADQPAHPGRRRGAPGLRRRPVTWADTWPGLVALAGMLAVLVYFALRGMRRTSY